MNKKWLCLALFAFVNFGSVASTWAEVRCLTLISSAKSSCCCPAGQKNHCPMPAKKTDCPMMTQSNRPDADLAPVRFVPDVKMVVVALIYKDPVPAAPAFDVAKPALLSLRTDRRKWTVPPFRAPPASSIAA